MNDCQLIPTGKTITNLVEFTCAVCGKPKWSKYTDPRLIHRACNSAWQREAEQPNGAGSQLKQLLQRIGITSDGGCGCTDHAKIMDQRGPDWCEENIKMIISWLKDAASKKGLPFLEWPARQIVLLAIRRARKQPAR